MSRRHGNGRGRHGGGGRVFRNEVMLPGGCMILDDESHDGRAAVSSGIRGCFGYDPCSLSMMLLTDGPAFEDETGHAVSSGADVSAATDPESRRIMIGEVGDELTKRMDGDDAYDPMVVVMTDPCAVSDDSDGDTWETLRRIAHHGPRHGISLLCLADGDDVETVRSLVTVPLCEGVCVVSGVHADNARRVRV